MAFEQREVPQLNLFCALTEHNKIPNIDFCTQLISSARSPEDGDIFYVAYTAKQGFICLLIFQEGCLNSKLNVEIQYSYSSRITTLKLITLNAQQNQKNKLSKGVYLMVGFEDGIISMYILSQSGNSPLTRIFKIKPKLQKKQMIFNLHMLQLSLLVVTSYNVFIFKNLFKKQQLHLKSSPRKAVKQGIQPQGQNIKAQQQKISIAIGQSKLNGQIDANQQVFYIYNETEGAICLNTSNFSQNKKVQDSIKTLCPCSKLVGKNQNILAIGCSDDCIKFINYKTCIVDKFVGLKNYPSCFFEDTNNSLLWVGCLDGSISCFSYRKMKPQLQKRVNFVMRQHKLEKNKKVNKNGIKKILVEGQILIILDCDHNIELYDIIPSLGTEYVPQTS